MKVLLIFLFPLVFFGQTITISDLAFGRTHKVFETQDYLLKKGLSFMGKTPSGLPDATIYGFSAKDIQYTLLVGDANGVVIQVEVYMSSSDNYTLLKQKAKELGYKLDDSFNENALESRYIKENSEITFSTGKNETHGVYYSIIYW